MKKRLGWIEMSGQSSPLFRMNKTGFFDPSGDVFRLRPQTEFHVQVHRERPHSTGIRRVITIMTTGGPASA
jgi:hypothetical protein